MRATRAAVLFLLTIALVAGCGGEQVGEVTGTVSYDGKPVEAGSITFTPADGKGTTAGGEIKDGKYSASRVPVGNAKVSISGAKFTGSKQMYPGDPKSVVQTSVEYLPAKYNKSTELQFEVKPGSQEKNFDLPK